MYKYKAIVIKVVDADTVKVDIDLGFDNWIHDKNLRILGINAPETRGDEREKGLVAKKFVEQLLPVGSIVEIHTEKTGKYGRYLAEVIYTVENVPHSLSEVLLELGYAKPYLGSGSDHKFPPEEKYPLDK